MDRGERGALPPADVESVSGSPAAIWIDDPDDPRLDPFRNIRERELRGDSGRFLAESLRVVRRLLASEWEIDLLLLNRTAHQALAPDLAARAPRGRGPGSILEVPDGLEATIAGARFHGGALALGVRHRHPALRAVIPDPAALPAPRVLLLEGLTHPDNIGSILRSADCLGAAAVVMDARCADPLLRAAIRFSMGRVFSLPWTVVDSLPAAARTLRQAGWHLVAAEASAESVPPRELPRDRPLAIWLGSEGHGISPEHLNLADLVVRIPTAGGTVDAGGEERSLNVAIAAAILLYEASR